MKTAFSHWNKRIAPVFDTARNILVIEAEAGAILSETEETLQSDPPVQKALQLFELGVGTLVCGAISQPLNEMVSTYDILVIAFVAGNLREVIQAWLKGNLEVDDFTMPGCKERHGFNTMNQGKGT
jgi:predicted Fe-Mo cluster-binding NifX family protein